MTLEMNQGPEQPGEEIDFRAVKRRFMLLNRARLQKARAALRDKQEQLLDLLPLLFHVNHPMLPGFASKDTPVGVWGYEPDRLALNLAKTLARSFSYRRTPKRQNAIHAIYFMGSTGTIAHAEGSDFDFWLCYDPKLSNDELDKLRLKAQRIEAWAAELGLEIHFFFIDPERFRQGQHNALSSESSGSAQHNLLLDEFYRTSVLLCGQFPLWWLVPPEYEAAYGIYVDELQRKRFLYARDCIDFGGLTRIPAEEFFGAALWQLSKGIDAPYKSILKLLLIEAYASEYPAMELLSKQLKQAVYDNRAEPEQLDPYLMMLEKVSDYLSAGQEHQRLELARRCFYFKSELRLSEPPTARRHDWRRELLREMVKAWHWSRADLMLMDAHRTWKVHRVVEERQILFEALMTSYRFLSDFARKYAGLSMISQHDLTTLGRKLYTAFERKAGKIDIVNRGIDADLYEEQMTLCEVYNEKGEVSGWHAFRGVLSRSEIKLGVPLKRSRSLVELVAWCYFNRVIGKRTVFLVHSPRSRHTARDVENLLQEMWGNFPLALLDSSDMHDFSQVSRLLVSELYINAGVHLSDNMMLTRNIAAMGQTDPFCYGHDRVSMIRAVDHLQVNSWHEVLTQRNAGENAVLESLCDFLKWYPRSSGVIPDVPRVYTMGRVMGSAVGHRVEELLRQVIALFYDHEKGPSSRYILNIARSYYVIEMGGDVPRYVEHRTLQSLLQYLGKAGEPFHHLMFDERSLQGSPLPLIYRYNKPGVVQLFYHAALDGTELYVLDEKGALFTQKNSEHEQETLVNHYQRFFDAVSNRINFMLQEGAVGSRIDGMEFYEINRDALGKQRLRKVEPPHQQPGKRFFSLQVIVEQNELGESIFTLYCDGREFSTLEFGNKLFDAVVKHVLQLRQSGQSYPIYITDISLDNSVIGEENMGRMQSVHFLNYKRRIEAQINRNL
ncbi:MAG: class I adenylate cyclase [Pseudomonadota bacterium]